MRTASVESSVGAGGDASGGFVSDEEEDGIFRRTRSSSSCMKGDSPRVPHPSGGATPPGEHASGDRGEGARRGGDGCVRQTRKTKNSGEVEEGMHCGGGGGGARTRACAHAHTHATGCSTSDAEGEGEGEDAGSRPSSGAKARLSRLESTASTRSSNTLMQDFVDLAAKCPIDSG